MATFTVGNENSTSIELYYEDHGAGKPVVLIHGYPLSAASWERQVPALLAAGRRVVAYDRRGFGRSSQPAVGYDYDTFAVVLHALLEKLVLREVALVGFSMGGGEVARYIGKYGTDRVEKAVFVGAVAPHLLKTDDDPEGVDGSVFEGIKAQIVKDRPAFFTGFFQSFFNVEELGGSRISDEAVRMSWNVAVASSPVASLACVDTWGTDFRADVAKIDVPTLVIHGDKDNIVPLANSGERTARLVPGARLVVVKDGPHAVNWTHADEVNAALVEFLA